MESNSQGQWMARRAMAGKPAEYARFLWMIEQRGMNISSLAMSLNGKMDGKDEARGRPALTGVLMGKRSGKRTWGRLRRVLNPAEYECIKAFADAEMAKAASEPSGWIRLRDENAALRSENRALVAEADALRRRIAIMEDAVRESAGERPHSDVQENATTA